MIVRGLHVELEELVLIKSMDFLVSVQAAF